MHIHILSKTFKQRQSLANIFRPYICFDQEPIGINKAIYVSGPFYQHGITLNPAWISNNTHYKVWDEITYPFLNFNGTTVEV